MLQPNALSAQEDGSIAYTDADDITVVEPITTRQQTAGGWYRDEPDHELAALMAAAPDLLAALQALESLAWPHLLYKGQPTGETLRMTAGEIAIDNARKAIARATNPDYEQNGIGQTRDRIMDPLLDIIKEAETHAARDAERLRFQRSLDAQRNAQHRAEENRVLEEAEAESEEELWPLVPYTFL